MGTVLALALGSCAYDPNYMAGGSAGVGYAEDTGYGDGYGYGGSGFSSSVFISTGDPRWGYDPYCYCYYDYHRRCYYDPYLYGYYPMGYRPMIVLGVPHPYGYSRSYCPPPTRVMNITLSNYHNRAAAYRSSNYGWAHQVRQQTPSSRSQPKIQQNSAPYARNTTANYASTRNPSQTPGGYNPPRSANPAARYPAGQAPANPAPRSAAGQPASRYTAGQPAGQPTGQPAYRNNPPGRGNPQGSAVQATDSRHGHAPAGTAPTSAGAAPQRQAPAGPTKGRGDKEGRASSDR